MNKPLNPSSPESPAKEQPGEQFAAPQRAVGDTAGQPGAYLAEVAAKDKP